MSMEDNTKRFFHIMEDVGINRETKICQYLDLEYLMKILITDRYYVKRKKFFVDNREEEFPLFLRFALAPVYPEDRQEQEASFARQQKELSENINQYCEQSNVLTSCWTIRTMENVLMWDRGNKLKACIHSTIGDFVDSFDKSIEFNIWCGRIFYEAFSKVMLSKNKIWVKEPYFSDEEELRFYFSAEYDEIKPDVSNRCPEKGLSLKVNPKNMMKEIVLSPYIDRQCANDLMKHIGEKYGITTSVSAIDLSNK